MWWWQPHDRWQLVRNKASGVGVFCLCASTTLAELIFEYLACILCRFVVTVAVAVATSAASAVIATPVVT